MKFMSTVKRKQSGISLLEVLLSLSIISIILVMATRYFFIATESNRINLVRQQVGSVIAAISSWKNQNPVYDGLSISSLYNDGFLAKSTSIVQAGDQVSLYDPWGKVIVVSSVQNRADITLTLPNLNDCKKLKNSFNDATCVESSGSAQFSLSIR